jgi:peptide/nickel transport system substrate-binding protein
MKKLSLVSAFAVAIMLVTLLAPTFTPSAKAAQPPVDTTTLYVGTIGWGPRRADPVRAYDTGSGELIFNVYDTLIFTKGEAYWDFVPMLSKNVPSRDDNTIVDIYKTVTSTDVNLTKPKGSHWSDGSVCVGWVDNHANGVLDVTDVVYMMESDGKYRAWQVDTFSAGPPVQVKLFRQKWIFNIRTTDAEGNPIYFVDEGDNIVGTFNASDAEYSIKRGLVQDQYGSPMWMFYKPLFDQMNSDAWDTGDPTDATTLAHLINDAIEVEVVGGEQYLIINLGMKFSEVAFKQILSQTWAAMMDKEFSISIGCWDGNIFYDSNPGGGTITGELLGWTWVRKKGEKLGFTHVSVTHEYVGTGDGSTNVFSLKYAPVVSGSEVITVGGVKYNRTINYNINYDTGVITFITVPPPGKAIYADYTYENLVFFTANAPILSGTETVYLNGTATTQYTINYATGEVELTLTHPVANYTVTIDYTWIRKKFQTKWWPIVEGSETVYLSGTATTQYKLNYGTGALKLTDGTDANYTVTIDYTYTGGFPDWFETGKPVTWWRHVSRSPYDKTDTIPRPPGVSFTNGYRYVGTGPYRVITFDSKGYKVEFARNTHYWKGWAPFPGGTTPRNHFEKIVVRYIADWTPRKNAFINGEIDVCAVPRANMFELLDSNLQPIYPGHVTIAGISPALSMDANHFTFTVDPNSEYVVKRADGTKLPNFFNNTHVRKAFAYSFDWQSYIRDAWFNEAIYRKNMFIYGLVPDFYNSTVPGYYKSLKLAEQELKAALLEDGKTAWEGFHLKLCYNTGNDQRRIACEMIRDFFAALGSQFTVEVIEIDWPTYLTLFEEFQLPMWSIGWLADFSDADNFARPYMHSWGDFAYFQGYTAENGWTTRGPRTGLTKDEIIDMALKELNETKRRTLYYDLQDIYYMDVPSYPLDIPIGRRFCWYWVKGWYYNALYPAQYYYSMYKEDTCWYNISGPEAGIPDDRTNIRDVKYLIDHFNAKAPEPGKPPHPKWVGTYGFGGVDPFGDRICNVRDIQRAILHFNHMNQP